MNGGELATRVSSNFLGCAGNGGDFLSGAFSTFALVIGTTLFHHCFFFFLNKINSDVASSFSTDFLFFLNLNFFSSNF
jgi:hypothetical protein